MSLRHRIVCIDTPELAHFGNPEECGAARATAALEHFIGRKVRLRRDFTQDARDRYGRLLRYARAGRASTEAWDASAFFGSRAA